jgi:acetyl esterase/lipase
MNPILRKTVRLLAPCLALAMLTAAAPTSERNVVYGMYSGMALLLDVERPAEPNGMAVLQIPGSGFQAALTWDAPALKDSAQAATAALLNAGFTVFTINHRAAPRFRFPAPVEDAQRAARFIRSEAKRFGVRPDRLAVLGTSSGGNLAAMLATVGEAGKPAPVRRPDCVVAVMAPLELGALGLDGAATGYTVSYLGHPPSYGLPGEDESFTDDYAAASPQTHISAAMSRMLLVHGDADRLVPIEQSKKFAEAASAIGRPVDLVTMQGAGHKFAEPYVGQAVKWLQRCMADAKPYRL